MQELKAGNKYSLTHTRFVSSADVILKGITLDGEWVDVEITNGEVQGLTNTWRIGDLARFRTSFCTFAKLKD